MLVSVFILRPRAHSRTPRVFLGFMFFAIVTANHCQPVSVTQGDLDPPGGICPPPSRLIHLPVEIFCSS